MKTVYVTAEQFAKAKTIEKFPNPVIKVAMWSREKVRLQIAGKAIVESLDKETATWFGYTGPENVVMINCKWFPKELLFDIDPIKRVYVPTPKKTGSLPSVNTGSCANLFLASKLKEAIAILKANNFTVEYKN